MQRTDADTVRFAAQLRVQVPRNADGTLEEGAAMVLQRVDAVLDVEEVHLQGIVPRLNDLTADVEVHGRLRLDPTTDDTDEYVRATLADGFGVAEVRQCSLRQIPDAPRTPVLEYG